MPRVPLNLDRTSINGTYNHAKSITCKRNRRRKLGRLTRNTTIRRAHKWHCLWVWHDELAASSRSSKCETRTRYLEEVATIYVEKRFPVWKFIILPGLRFWGSCKLPKRFENRSRVTLIFIIALHVETKLRLIGTNDHQLVVANGAVCELLFLDVVLLHELTPLGKFFRIAVVLLALGQYLLLFGQCLGILTNRLIQIKC